MSWNRLHRWLRVHIAGWEMELARDWGEGAKGYYYHLKLHNLGWPSCHEVVARTPGKLLKQLRRDARKYGRLWHAADRYQKKHGRWALDDYLGRGNPTEEMAETYVCAYAYVDADGRTIEGESR